MNNPIRILGLAGSLRKASYNRAALRAAQQLVPAGAKLDIIELDGIPPFNQDDEASPPPTVAQFKARIKDSDAVLFVTPEYNYSVPGVLKNAIDWAGRPYGQSAWQHKPAAIMGASIGSIGTARAIPFAADDGVSRYACRQSAGSDDRFGGKAVQRSR